MGFSLHLYSRPAGSVNAKFQWHPLHESSNEHAAANEPTYLLHEPLRHQATFGHSATDPANAIIIVGSLAQVTDSESLIGSPTELGVVKRWQL